MANILEDSPYYNPSNVTDLQDTNTYDSAGSVVEPTVSGNLDIEGRLNSINKKKNLALSGQDKQRKIGPSSTSPTSNFKTAILTSLPDADSPVFEGVTGGIGGYDKKKGIRYDTTGQASEDRLLGADAYEVEHDSAQNREYLSSPSGQRKVLKQRAQLARQYNVPLADISYEDVKRAGMDERYDALNLLNVNADGSVQKDPLSTTMNEDGTGNIFGTKDKPLGLEVQRDDTGSKGWFGRPLTNVKSQSGQNLTDSIHESGRDGSKKIYLTPAEKLSILNGGGSRSDSDGQWGEAADIAQSGLAKFGGDAVNMLGKGMINAADYFKDGKLDKAKYQKRLQQNNLPFTKRNLTEIRDAEKMDEEFGVKKSTRIRQQQLNQSATANIEAGNYTDAAMDIFKNMPAMLGDSAAESVALMVPYVGLATVVATRTSNQAEVFEEKNGRPPTTEELAQMVATNTAVLGAEKLLIKSGLSNVGKGLVEKAGRGKRALGVAGSTAGEAGQEYADYIQEEYNTQKVGDKTLGEIATSPEAKLAVAAGGAMGGALRGAGEAAGLAKDELIGNDGIVDKTLTKLAEDRATKQTQKTKDKSAKEHASKQAKYKEDVAKHESDMEMYDTGAEDAKTSTDDQINEVYELMKDDSPDAADAYLAGAQGKDAPVLDAVDPDIEVAETKVDDTETVEPIVEETAEVDTETNTDLDKQVDEHYDNLEPTEKKDLERRLENAGISKSEKDMKAQLKKDMEAGLTVETIEKKDGTKTTEIANRKNKKYAPHEVTDDMLMSIPEGTYNESKFKKIIRAVTDSKLIQRITKKFKNSSDPQREIARINKNIQKTFKNSTALDGLVDKDAKGSAGKALRIAALTLGAVQSAITSEFDMSKNAGVNRSDGQARLDGLVQQLGKDYMNSYGLKYSGNPESMAKRYAEIGQKMLNFAIESGMVQTQEGQVVASQITSKDGKGKSLKDMYKNRSTKEVISSNKSPVLMLQTDTVSLTDNTSEKRDVSSDNANNLSLLNRLLSPTNYQVPGKEAVENVPSDEDIGVLHEAIIKKYNGLKYNIKPEFVEMLKKIKKLVDTKYDGDFDAAIKKSNIIKTFIASESTFAAINKPKEEGRERFRGDNLRSLLDNLDGLTEGDGKFNFSYFSAINQRIHVMETILDYQGDKFMARQMVTGGEYTTENESEANVLIEDIGENSMEMFSQEAKDELNSVDITSERALEIYKKELAEPSETITTAFENMNNKGGLSLEYIDMLSKQLGSENPFQMVNNLQAWKDVYDAKGGPITSQHMVEFDATASGVVNTLLNLSGNPKVRKVLDAIGIMYKGKASGNADPYGWLNKTVAEQDTFAASGLESEIKRINKLGISLRNLAKYPVMKWFYGQAEDNVATEMSKELAYDVINKAIHGNKEAMLEVSRITGKKFTPDGYDLSPGAAFEAYSNKQQLEKTANAIREISDADIAKMENYYTEKVSKYYVASLEKAFPGVTEYRTKMSNIYDELQKTGKWKGKLGSGMQAMYPNDKGAKKMSVEKDKQYMVQNDAPTGYPWLMLNDRFNNSTSLGVNPQHSSDGTQLLGGLDEAMYYDDEHGIMSVHDAVYASPKSAILIKGRYENDTVELANEYDYIETALNELQDAITAMPETIDDGFGKTVPNVDKQARQGELDTMRADHAAEFKSKSEFLSDVTTNIFGSKTVETNFTKKASRTRQKRRAKEKSSDTAGDEKYIDPKVEAEKQKKADAKKKNKKTFAEFSAVIDEVRTAINSGSVMDLMNVLEKFKGKISEDSMATLNKVLEALDVPGLISDIKVDDKKGYSGGYGQITFPSDISVQPVGNLNMTMDKFVEVIGHEIDHAINFKYIQDSITGRKSTASEIKYIQKALHRLNKMLTDNVFMDDAIAERVKYMTDPISDEALKVMSDETGISEKQLKDIYMVTEFASIMRNEPAVRDAVLKAFGNKQSIIDKILSLVQKAYEYVKSSGPEAVSKFLSKSRKNGNFAAFNINVATESLMANAAVMSDEASGRGVTLDSASYGKNKENKSDPYEGDKWANINPRHYAQYVISKQNSLLSKFLFAVGGGAVDLAGPVLMKSHRGLNKRSDLYRGAVSLIRSGFWDSDLANKMKVTIGITGDVDEKLMNDFLTLGTDIIQKSHDLLTKNLPELDKRITKAYPNEKDRVNIYKIFAKTGFADIAADEKLISSLLDRDKSIDELIGELTKGWSKEQIAETKGLAHYYVTGQTKTNLVNTSNRGLFTTNSKQVVALMALNEVPGSQDMLVNMNKSIRDELLDLAIIMKSTSDTINHQAPRSDGKPNEDDAEYNDDYDGHYSMDTHDKIYEYRTVNQQDMKYGKFPKEEDWVVIKEPANGIIGVVARKQTGAGSTDGIGLNKNRFENGFSLDEAETLTLKNRLDKMDNKKPNSSIDYLAANNIVKLKGRYKFIVDENTKRDKLGLVQNAAQTMYRTIVHNKELIEMQSVRDLVLDAGTKDINSKTEMKGLSDLITKNRSSEADDRDVIPMFLNVTYEYGSYDDLPTRIKKVYKRPENLSTYNNFNQKVTLVRRDMADQLVGHTNFQIFGKSGTSFDRKMARAEEIFKEIVVHSKMLMVVTAPLKLAADIASNIGILSAMDVSVFDMPKDFKRAFVQYKSFSNLRGQLIQAEIASLSGDKKAQARRDKLQHTIEKHPFYKSFQSGFIQSYSTDLMVKEFDTISGLQKDIEDAANWMTTAKDGKKNEVHKAMKWWMNFGSDYGFTIDALLRTASTKTKLDGTSLGDNMIDMAQRLKETRDGEDMSKYVSNIIGSPSSEIVSLGGAVMVISDALSKKVLADSLQKQINPLSTRKAQEAENKLAASEGRKAKRLKPRKYSEDEAYMKANQTFIDFRVNMPAEVKALSDYGILMFPSFWMKTQRVIAGLIMYHPISAVGGYLAEYSIGVQQSSILDANFVSKIYDENVFHAPGEAVDFNHISPWISMFG